MIASPIHICQATYSSTSTPAVSSSSPHADVQRGAPRTAADATGGGSRSVGHAAILPALLAPDPPLVGTGLWVDWAHGTIPQARRSRHPEGRRRSHPNAVWFKPVMVGFMLLGLAWILVFYITGMQYPIPACNPGTC
jgi:hypothetical protein